MTLYSVLLEIVAVAVPSIILLASAVSARPEAASMVRIDDTSTLILVFSDVVKRGF